jgi:alpha-galactosidase
MKNIFALGVSMFAFVLSCFAQQSIELKNWKFSKGDDLGRANPSYDDSEWKSIKVGTNWSSQGYDDGGYAWYRIKFTLPMAMKDEATTGVLRFSLGKINDYEQTSLNGEPLGENGELIPCGKTNLFHAIRPEAGAHGRDRNYTVLINDSRLLWGKENVLAVRISNDWGGGGMYSLPVSIGPGDIKDCLVIDADSKMVEISPEHKMRKTILLNNISCLPEIMGKLTIVITNQDTGLQVAKQSFDVSMKRKTAEYTIVFKGDFKQRMKAVYTFKGSELGGEITCVQTFPYILTPKPAEVPKINGAKVVGVGVDRDFLFRIAATGIRPMTFSAKSLPEGLVLDSDTGIITGTIKQPGEYMVKLEAKNQKGETVRDLKIVVGGLLALTPPMGWNSWNGLGYNVTEDDVRTTVDVLNESGLANHGWTYVNIDIGWEPAHRNADGTITPNAKFYDMKSLVDYIHGNGFKAGIYISAGPEACRVYGVDLGIGSYEHNETDAQAFANWGFDYLKFDWCSYPGTDHSPAGLQKPFKDMKAALDKTHRDFVFSLGGWSEWEWGGSIGGNLWRVVSDFEDNWKSVKKGFDLEMTAPYAKPGNWNDPDMLGLGYGWYGDNTRRMHPTHLTPDEQYTLMSLWSLLSAPLLIGSDLTKLDEFTKSLLENDEVLSIDQDSLGKQALPAFKNDNYVVMVKDLEDGSKAVGLFNLTEGDLNINANWAALKVSGQQKVRDLWRQKDLGTFADGFESSVPPHGVVLVKVSR